MRELAPAAAATAAKATVRLDEWLTPSFGYSLRDVIVLADVQSSFQHVQVIESPTFGVALRLDGAMQCSERDEFFYHEPLVHVALLHAARVDRVLIVGGGDGGAAEEALKWSGVARLDHVEIDATVLELSRRHLAAIHRGVLDGADRRYRCHVADGQRWVADAPAGHYDVIVLDLTDAGGPSTALYGREFFAACSRALRPGGVLTLHVAAPWAQRLTCEHMLCRLRQQFEAVRPYIVSVPMSGGQWMMALCGPQPLPDLRDDASIDQRLGDLRGPRLRVMTAEVMKGMFALPPYLSDATVE
jgi:spermidine synthase